MVTVFLCFVLSVNKNEIKSTIETFYGKDEEGAGECYINDMNFKIIYKTHWRKASEQYEDTKEEITIHSDGCVLIRRFDHHGPNGHYRIVEKGKGQAEPSDVKGLYTKLMNLVSDHDGMEETLCDADSELLLIEDGIKISIHTGLYKGKIRSTFFIKEFIKNIQFEF